MIYTITLNPAFDYEMHLDYLKLNETQRIIESRWTSGGKGINVSRGLKRLGLDAINLGFVGGFLGEALTKELSKEGLKSDFVSIDDMTRLNVKLKTHSGWTEINGKSPIISKSNQNTFLNRLYQITDASHFVISGSLPHVHKEILIDIMKFANAKGINVILDVSGDDYNHLLCEKPMLIKPNLDELRVATNLTDTSRSSVIQAGYRLMDSGAKTCLISLSEDGAILIENNHVYHAKALKGTPTRLYGAGDHMIAGYLYAAHLNLSTKEKLAYAIAQASQHIFDLSLTPETFKELTHKIEIEEVLHD